VAAIIGSGSHLPAAYSPVAMCFLIAS